eukprot:gene42008-55744_t
MLLPTLQTDGTEILLPGVVPKLSRTPGRSRQPAPMTVGQDSEAILKEMVAQEPSSRIHFNEVVTRDGFQNESVFIETDDKVALIDALSACGYAKIEVTSFTSAKAIPMLRDAEAVMHRIRRVAGVEYSVLVPNVRGAERALECRPDELNLVMSCSESHNLANLRMARHQSLQTLLDVVRHVQQAKPLHPVAVNVSLSCVFGCPIEGAVPLSVVQQLVQTF